MMQVNKTSAFVSVFPVLVQQVAVGCKNPLCDNIYCKSSQAARESAIFSSNGTVNTVELMRQAQISGNMFQMLCKLPLKVLLCRVKSPTRRFDPKSQMFSAIDVDLSENVFTTLKEAERALPAPFASDIMLKYYFVLSPCYSFTDLNNFLCVGTTTVLEQFYNFRQWISILRDHDLEGMFMRELARLYDTASSVPKEKNTITVEESSSIVLTAFLIFSSEGSDFSPYAYSYQANARLEPINETTRIDIHDTIEKYIGESSDGFKGELIHFVDTMFMLLTTQVGYSCDSCAMSVAPTPRATARPDDVLLSPSTNSNTQFAETPSAMSVCADASYKFVRDDMFNSAKVAGDSNYLCKTMFMEVLNFLKTRLVLAFIEVEMRCGSRLPMIKSQIPVDTQYRFKNMLKLMDMMWFLNMKFKFVKESAFHWDEVNDPTKYNLINDLVILLNISRVGRTQRADTLGASLKGIIFRGETRQYDSFLNVPNFETDLFLFRATTPVVTNTELQNTFSLLFHPYLFTSEVKARIMKAELRMNHTADVPIFPNFIPGIPIRNVEFIRAVPIQVSREDIVQDTFNALSKINPADLARSVLKVKFKGEEGIDEGGVSVEFFNIIMDKLVNPRYGMFVYLDKKSEISESGDRESEVEGETHLDAPLWFNKLTDLYNYQHSVVRFNGVTIPVPPYLVPGTCGQLKATKVTEETLHYTGMLFGLAINNGIVMEVDMPRLFYRKLSMMNMGGTCRAHGTVVPRYMVRPYVFSLDDLATINPTLASSLGSLVKMASDPATRDEDIDALELYQSAESSAYDTSVTIPLVDIPVSKLKDPREREDAIPKVTRATAIDFVKAYIKHECGDGVRSLFEAFNRGFRSVLDCVSFGLLSARDIRSCLVGTKAAHDTIEELQKHCSYEGFGTGDRWIQWFWSIVCSWDDKKIRKLLKFVTGSGRISVAGAKGLNFRIMANGDNDSMLPTSHVCFNILMLPKYSTKEVMESRLSTAIHNSEGFGLR